MNPNACCVFPNTHRPKLHTPSISLTPAKSMLTPMALPMHLPDRCSAAGGDTMTRINVAKSISETRNSTSCNSETRQSVSWGRAVRNNASPLVFAAVLIVCSLAVGCSSEKPQTITSNNPAPIAQPTTTMAANTAPAPLPEAKPASKKVVHKRPATVTYTEKTYGVSFAYPRRYAIETGDATKEVLMSSPLPMNFVQPGGVALAAVAPPETGFANTDFSSAFFDVSVNNTLTADQCSEFSVPQPKLATAAPATEADSKQPVATPEKSDAQSPKLMLGDLEMHGAEAVSGEGASQSDSKYFHVFQNGACYEIALSATTTPAQADASLKHIDREKVFARLQTILSSVKIDAPSVDQGKVAEKKDSDTDKHDAQAGDTAKIDASSIDPSKSDAAKPVAEGTEIDPSKSDAAKPVAEGTDAPKPNPGTQAAPSTTPTLADPAPVAAAAPATPASNIPPQ